jgi:hypothetical protein
LEPFVFLSHATADKDLAGRLVAYLEAAGVRCWVASRDIPSTDTQEAAVAEALEGCFAIALVSTQEATYSSDVRNQIATAFKEGKIVLSFLPPDPKAESVSMESLLLSLRKLLGTMSDAVAAPMLPIPIQIPSRAIDESSPLEVVRQNDPSAAAFIEGALIGGNKLRAIQLYRQATGLGLRESKDAIDEICAKGLLLSGSSEGDARYGGSGCTLGVLLLSLLILITCYL